MRSFRFKSSEARSRGAQRSAAEAVTALLAAAPLAEPAEGSEASAKGWYASSLELKLGLEVTEDVPADQWPAEFAARLVQR